MMHVLSSIGAFAGNLIAALLLISAFVFIYVRTTPYVEREQIANGNAAVAIALGGALIGYAVVLARAISFSEWIGEMVLWGLVGLCVQVAGHFILARILPHLYTAIETRDLAAGVTLASVSLALGLLNAACMTP